MLVYQSLKFQVNRKHRVLNPSDLPWNTPYIIEFSNRDGSGRGSYKIGISHVSRSTGTSQVPLPLPSAGRCPHRRSQTSIWQPIFSCFCLFYFHFMNNCRFNHLLIFLTADLKVAVNLTSKMTFGKIVSCDLGKVKN